MPRSPWLILVLLAWTALLSAGCASEPVEPIARWELDVPGEAPVAITLPGRLPLPDRPLRYVLRADAPLAPEARGHAASVSIADTLVRGVLQVDGHPALSCLPPRIEGYRGDGAQCWHFVAPDAPSVHLEIAVDHTTPLTAVFGTAPELAASPDGGARFRQIVGFAEVTEIGSVCVASLMGFFYLGAFLLDRSRRAHALFALQAVGGAAYPLWWLGVLQPVFGPADRCVLVLSMLVAGLASVHLAHAELELGPVHRVWRWIVAAGAATGLAQVVAFPPRILPLVTAAFISMPTAAVAVLCARSLRRSRDRLTPAIIGLTWLLILVAAPFEVPALVGLPAHEGGVRLMSLAMAIAGIGQGALLARQHVTSLRDADVLNAELRRQVAERSKQLADALAQLGSERERWLAVGDVVGGRYRVVRPLGAGGMGEVYEVERLADGRRLALKVVQGAATRDQLARLAREAQIAAHIDHPNLVAVLDVDFTTEHGLYFVMELVEGGTLADQRAHVGDPAWALPVLQQVSDGLAALHEAGVVHRDLKPANVIVESGGSAVKITDFGIASIVEPPVSVLANTVSGSDSTQRAAMTRTGILLGTPRYMAPELVGGSKRASPAVDVFALGILACELLDLGYPFTAPPIVDAIYGRTSRRTRPLSEANRVTGELAATLEACLQLDPGGRPTARAVSAAIRAALA
jgi:hypothetical protein